MSFCIEVVKNILPCSGEFKLRKKETLFKKKTVFKKDKLKRIRTSNILSNTTKNYI